MHVLVTRPEPEATALAERLAALGIAATLAPLATIEPCPPPRLPTDNLVGVAATSRNALKAIAGHADLAILRRLPMIVVGPGTAATARNLGFADIVEGPGAASELPELVAARVTQGPLLILRGAAVAFDLAGVLSRQGRAVREAVVYRTRPATALPEAARRALSTRAVDGVVLMSPDTAKVFTKLVMEAGLTSALTGLTYFCLSSAVADAAVAPATAVVTIAVKPNLEEMLALVARTASQSSAKL